MPRSLLLVEDEPAVRRSISQSLRELGLEVHATDTAETALDLVEELEPDVVLSDVRLPGMDGIELLRLLRKTVPSVDVILITAYDDMATVARAMREGAFDFLVKPLDLAALTSVLERVFEDQRAREQARREIQAQADAHSLDALVGRDPSMIEVYKRVGQLAASRVTVLLRGETGTGKGLVARAIHFNSPDAEEPFIAVNCTALPESLLESELFGHIRGAFTGAVADRQGRFALAGRGTIFLDEVGDTSTEFQAKILHVLEDHEFQPVGADRPERTEARVIAGTHRDLQSLISRGQFRQDLYYRLRVVEVFLPALRNRVQDIPLLTSHFVRKLSAELHRPEPAIAEESFDLMLQHDWPGNVRELENCLARAMVLATGGVIRPEHLALGAQDMPSADGFPSLAQMEARHVAGALTAAEGNKTRAAELLGISKPRLYRSIEKYGLG